MNNIKWKDLVQFRIGRGGVFLPDKMEELVDTLIGGKTFDELMIPLAVTAVDVNTGEQVVLKTGKVSRAVRASATVPGVFIPLEIEGKLLIDGGMVSSLPGDVVKDMGADIVLGINLNGGRVGEKKAKRAMQIVKSTFSILVNNNLLIGKRYVDLMVEPDLCSFSYSNLRPRMKLVEKGEEAMREKLPALLSFLDK